MHHTVLYLLKACNVLVQDFQSKSRLRLDSHTALLLSSDLFSPSSPRIVPTSILLGLAAGSEAAGKPSFPTRPVANSFLIAATLVDEAIPVLGSAA